MYLYEIIYFSMKRTLVFIAIFGLWALPLIRALRFFRYASRVYSGDSSINAMNDYIFSRAILGSYLFTLSVGIFIAWLFFFKRNRLMAFPLAGSFLIPIVMILKQPEQVIVLFPTMSPDAPALLSIILLAVSLASLCFNKKARHDDDISNNSAQHGV